MSNNDAGAALSGKPTVYAVAAALFDSAGRVLIAQRPPGKQLAGRWEFPGGKIEEGESEAQALARELEEELGVRMESGRPLLRLNHEYPERYIELSLWIVERFAGEPRGLDGQRLKWVSTEGLAQEDLLEADLPFIAVLQRLYNAHSSPD